MIPSICPNCGKPLRHIHKVLDHMIVTYEEVLRKEANGERFVCLDHDVDETDQTSRQYACAECGQAVEDNAILRWLEEWGA